MKSSKVLLLCTIVMVSSVINAHKVRRAIDVSKYLTGNYVDENGQTILHKIAQNCDNDKFTLKIKPFDFLENKFPEEKVKLEQKGQQFQDMARIISQELLMFVMIGEAIEFIETKDNNGETALDIARKRNALTEHTRCNSCVELLEKFELLKNDLRNKQHNK